MNITGTNGSNCAETVPPLPDWAATRRDLIATRKKHGANTPVGHRCSNILEQLENYQKCPAGIDRLGLRNIMGQSMAELAALLSKGDGA